MTPNAHTPGVAHRATGAELWLRDMDGRGLGMVPIERARSLVENNAAYPDIAPDGKWREVRLKVALPPNSRRTFFEHRGAEAGNRGARYEHNHRACNLWTH